MKNIFIILIAISISYGQTTPDLTEKQRYLNGKVDGSTPYRGINIKPVWDIGYYGQGIHVADIQYDWDLDHEDLAEKNIKSYYDNTDMGQQQHGTNAIGIIAADDNGFGMTGISHGCELSVWDIYEEMTGQASWGRSIKAAADMLEEGDIIQLEVSLQTSQSSPPLPPEINPPIHDAIKYAVNKGIIVLQAAGNGNTNLNTTSQMPSDDNGSIMVGNGSINQVRIKTGMSAVNGSNYGRRVNVQAWGDTVVATLGTWSWSGVNPISGFHGETFGNSDHRAYCYQFSGTSSALPIVSGVCAVIQSFAKDSLGYTLTSQEMRDLLIKSGHPQDSSTVSGHIGPIPDAERAIKILTGDTITTDIAVKSNSSFRKYGSINNNILSLKEIRDYKIKVININGQEVKEINLENKKSYDLNRLSLARGFYVLKVTNKNSGSLIKWHNR